MSLPNKDRMHCPVHRSRLEPSWYRARDRHRGRLAEWGARTVPPFTSEKPMRQVLEPDIWRRPPPSPRSGSLTRAALSQLAGADHQRAKMARKILADFSVAAEAFDTSGAPDLHLTEGDDEMLLVEWVLSDRRLGFSFEKQPEESGWYFVLSNDSSERYEAGTLDQLELPRLIRLALAP